MVVAFQLCPVGNLVGSLIGNFARRVNAAADAMVTHHKLKVYQKALALGASAAEFSSRWGGPPAVSTASRHELLKLFSLPERVRESG